MKNPHAHVVPGDTLRLVDVKGREVNIRRRGDAAPGRFRVRQRAGTVFVQFEFYSRESSCLKSRYIGAVEMRQAFRGYKSDPNGRLDSFR